VGNEVVIFTSTAKQYVRDAIERHSQDQSILPALCRTSGFETKDVPGGLVMSYRGVTFGVAGYKEIHPGFGWYIVARCRILIHKTDLEYLYDKVVHAVTITNPHNGREVDALLALGSV